LVLRILQSLGITPNVVVCHLPLVSEGETIGILWLWGEGLREGDLPALSIFARQVAAAIQNANLLAEVSRLAITDDLTDIFNRRHFFDLAAREFSQAQRHRQPLAVMIMDVDFFKKYNDQYGHQVGDEVLRGVAQRLQASLRESDILGRYGGEEFSVLLPQTDIESAMEAAERLHASVADEPIQTQAGPLYVQLSIGVAALQPDTISLHALINRADQAMYAAKDAGRNRVAMK
jgi:diguanylate cyclase (GGDEF)-like protein